MFGQESHVLESFRGGYGSGAGGIRVGEMVMAVVRWMGTSVVVIIVTCDYSSGVGGGGSGFDSAGNGR